VQPPTTQYVERDGVSIAYQVVGDGPVDLVLSPGFISHLDLAWTDPGTSRLLARLASFSRLILYDKPGTGLSDPIPHLPTLEERGADIEAVLDAAGSERAVLFGVSEGGPTAVVLAATRPERVASLILYGTFAVLPSSAPEAYAPEVLERFTAETGDVRDAIKHWGDGARLARVFAPSLGERQMRIWGTFARAAASPRMAEALIRTVMQIDVRDVLASVHVPTLVLHLEGDRTIPVEAGQLLAAGIPDARFVTFPGDDHVFWLGQMRARADEVLDEVEGFVTGAVQAATPDRVLTTLMFTDIVGSTSRAAELGDSAWRALLERHDALVQGVVNEHGGRVVKHIGDGALSAFDGNPATLHPLPPQDSAKRYLEFMGGADAVLHKAREAYDRGEYRWVAEVVNHVVFAEPQNQAARALQADTLEQLGYQSEAGTWRNLYLTGAQELRDGTLDLPLPSSASPDAIKAMSLDLFFNYLGVRLNGVKAGDVRLALNWVFTDSGEQVALLLSNGALSHVLGRTHEVADATVTLTRAALNRFILGESSLDDEAKAGEITVEPDLAALDQLLALLDEFSLWFNIIEP